jgi:transmembrane sensor
MDRNFTLDPATQEAIDWEVRLRSGEVTQEERDAFTAWRSADPAREEAWTRLQQRLGRLGALQGASGVAVRRALEEPTRGRRRLLKAGGGGAAVLLAGIGTRRLVSAWSLDADYQNGRVNSQRIVLGGDLQVMAGAAARVYVDGRTRGDIYLAAGQIAVEVDRRGYQPIVVTTRDGVVHTESARVSVDVLRLHTIVAVQGGDAVLAVQHGRLLRVPDGSAWSLSGGKIAHMPETSADIFSWTQGSLVVLDRAVPDVVETLGRYFDGYIRFPEGALSRRVSGVFSLNDVKGALQQLAESLGFSLKLYGNVLAVATQA